MFQNLQQTVEPIVVSDSGRTATMAGSEVAYKVTGEQTQDRFALLELTVAPDVLFAPPHIHQLEDEWLYVLQGHLTVTIGSETVQARSGDTVFMPRGVPHAAANPDASPTRLLMLISPAGFEPFFEELAAVMRGLPPFPAAAITDFGATMRHSGLFQE